MQVALEKDVSDLVGRCYFWPLETARLELSPQGALLPHSVNIYICGMSTASEMPNGACMLLIPTSSVSPAANQFSIHHFQTITDPLTSTTFQPPVNSLSSPSSNLVTTMAYLHISTEFSLPTMASPFNADRKRSNSCVWKVTMKAGRVSLIKAPFAI